MPGARDSGSGSGPLARFAAGVALLPRGLAMYGRNPGLVLLGIVPALLAAILVTGCLVLLIVFVGPISAGLTGFADHWSPAARTGLRDLLAVAIVGVAVLLAVVAFTSVTLAVGDPFYEKISERIERQLGGVPAGGNVAWWRELIRTAGDSARLLARSVLFGVPLFLAGLIPVVGQTVVPVIGAFVGGWALAVELTGPAFARRGLRLADRRRALRAHRALALGFGVAVFACFLIPFGAILGMPAAVAGATLLSRRVLGEPTRPPVAGGPPGRAIPAPRPTTGPPGAPHQPPVPPGALTWPPGTPPAP